MKNGSKKPAHARQQRVLHIIPVGQEIGPIMVGIRAYPVSAVALVHDEEMKQHAERIGRKLSILDVPIDLHRTNGDPFLGVMTVINRISEKAIDGDFDEILVNIGAASKDHATAALTAAHVNGLETMTVSEGRAIRLPVLKYSFRALVSPAKMEILQALSDSPVSSLAELSSRTGLEKSLISYHIRGGKEVQGLEQLDLLDIQRGRRGSLSVDLTMMGRMVLVGRLGA